MVNYENGMIYRLKSISTNLSYIGSTSMPYLSQRLAHHKYLYKRYLAINKGYTTSFKILECEDYEIELICNFPCVNKQQLQKEEGKYIKKEKEEGIYECVNMVIAGRSYREYYEDNKDILVEKCRKYKKEHKEEMKEYFKKYNNENKEKRKENWKKYYDENKEKLLEKAKIYAEENKEKITERKKQYREKNKEKIKEYDKKHNAIKVICEICGEESTKNHLKRHQRTLKCKSVVNK